MKKLSSYVVLLMTLVLVPVPGRAAEIPDLSGFKQPVSKCLKPSNNLIITSVGLFQGSLDGLAPLEVVATVQPSTHEIAITDHASISIFDAGCHLMYQQMFPMAGEITFETIHLDNQTLLHLVSVSAVGEPADDVIFNHIILIENYDGSLLPLQLPFLTSDKSLSIFIGNIGPGKGFGIVETIQPTYGLEPRRISPISVMFQLKDVPLPEGQTLSSFVGPTVIHAAPHTDSRYAWPDTSYATGFPLMHYLFGNQL